MGRILIVGAGGLGRDVFCYLKDERRLNGNNTKVFFLDDNPDTLNGHVLQEFYRGSIDEFTPTAQDRFIIGVGEPSVRLKIAERLEKKGAKFSTLIHSTAYVAESAIIEPGTIVAPFSYIGPDCRVGKHVVFGTYASMGHESSIGDYCVLSPYAVLNGNVKLGHQVFMGTQACVVLGLKVGEKSKIGAGAIVLKDVPERSLAIGSPARFEQKY
jgi:sugar O-acyltransferase (sialic acid O-acetyltransferase NeuD family)